jgi:thiol-disulfide isomerase/thioredoxin
MYIKSRELLPVDQQVTPEGEDEGEDPRWELIRQLVEYKKFKDAAAQLQTMEIRQEDVFPRLPVKPDFGTDNEPRGKAEASLFDLINAVNAILKRLKGHKEAVRVLTFFGTWCPHCKQRLPLLLKVEQGLAGSKFQFEYYGLPSPFDSEPEAKSHKIDGVPTAILYVGDKEIGRIPHSQWSNPEVALDLQLNGPGRSKAR